MRLFWIFNGQQLFFSPPDGGGSGGGGDTGDEGGGDGGDGGGDTGEHPDFEVPRGVGDQDAGDGDGDGDTGAAGDGTPARRPKPKGQVDTVPKHRLDEVIRARDEFQTRLSTLEAENKRFKSIIGRSLGIEDPNNPEPKPLTDREKAVQKRILDLFPWMGKFEKLADKAEVLEGLVNSVPDFERQNKQYWDRVATTMVGGMEAQLAPLYLGEGKTAKDMPKEVSQRLRRDFFSWVQASEERITRYESLDEALISDFVTEYDQQMLAPLRRRFGADTLARSRGAARLPVGGNSSAPTTTPKPKSKPLDEDSAADAAWKDFQERVSAGA